MDKYYREQLERLRQGAGDFARRYPAIAPMLLGEGGDPDVERILEGCAWLCAKIHERLDRTAPDLVQSLLRLLFPQAILPEPSTTLLKCTLEPACTEPIVIPRGTKVGSHPVDGVSCLYSTAQDLTVLPMEVSRVTSRAEGSSHTTVTVFLTSTVPISSFLPDTLTFYLTGSYAVSSQRLMALLTRTTSCDVGAGTRRISLGHTSIRHHNLPLKDMRLPEGRQANRGYMELLRYFLSRDHLLGFTVSGLKRLEPDIDARELVLSFHIMGSAPDVPEFPEACLLCNVVRAANIFHVQAEPLVIDHSREEYLIRSENSTRRFLEILGIEHARALFPGGRIETCRPYEAYDTASNGFFYSMRFRRSEKDNSIEHLLTPLYRLKDRDIALERCTLSMTLLCCNHTLPSSLQAGDICRPTDSTPARVRFSNISAPSPMFFRHTDESMLWRFLSFMNTNLLSLASADALRSLLELYLPERGETHELAAANRRRIQAVTEFSSGNEERLFRGRLFRGRLLDLTLDPAGFVSEGDLYLFAGALERFFAEYANLNTYSRLHVRVGGTGRSHQWPPRLGSRQLI